MACAPGKVEDAKMFSKMIGKRSVVKESVSPLRKHLDDPSVTDIFIGGSGEWTLPRLVDKRISVG
jgi:hypothetical protein